MFRFDRKLAFFIVLGLVAGFSHEAHAQRSTRPSQVNQEVAASRTKKTGPRAPRTYTDYEIGASYIMFNEAIKISRAGSEAKGIANFGGFGVGLEKHFRRSRYLYAITATLAGGKATAGGFSGPTTFADGVNRAWWAAHLSLSANYKLNPSFYIGAGLLGRYRDTDWQPSDPTLEVAEETQTPATAQLILRWEIARSIQITQTYAPLDFRGNSLWQWIFMLRL